MKQYELHLSMSAEKYLNYYRGTIKQVVARSTGGEWVQFPAALLTRFVTNSGIHGHFLLTCESDNSGAKLQKLSD